MNIEEASKALKYFNEWRRGGCGEQPIPKDVGIAIDTVLAELDKANSHIAELTGKLSSHEKLCVEGIYYKESDLDIARACWEKMAVNKATKDIQAKAVMEAAQEIMLLTYGEAYDYMIEYANKLLEGKV